MSENEIFALIKEEITKNDVVLFMKGTTDFPQCGFSSHVVAILKKLAVEFKDINVLANLELREGIKHFTDWPTIPQLYVKGEFIGGCDIVREMYENGDLLALLQEKQISTVN